MKKFILSAFFILAVCGFSFAQTSARGALDKVKQIKLLEDRPNDVRRILVNFDSTDFDEEKHFDEFFSDFARIEVSYSTGSCRKDVKDAAENDEEDDDEDISDIWNVGEWKATKIIIAFRDEMKIEDAGYDLSKFTKAEQDNKDINPGLTYYNRNLGIVLRVYEDELESVVLFPPSGSNSKLCDNKWAKKILADEDWLDDVDGFRVCYLINPHADVTDLTLSASEITAACAADKTQAKNPSEKANRISVKTVAYDPDNDVLTYNYEVSGGRIVGQGANVVWDLTGVQPGTYTITAGVDDGCGICGTTRTETVTVWDCPNKKENKNP